MLSLELVKKELEVNNYSPVIHKISNKEILLFSVEDEDKIPIMNKISNVVIENENIVLTYFKKQIDIKKEFKTINDFIKFVKEIFPVSK
ncbi:hypothetical protein FIA58_007595 [Flavobacterium jejuense]|uniref:Uncharacterized protein n=1 Tax=Flavobacterium jejuense TaxID=1544455 RepID=A0ABX0INZ4_9FLAO|nr:hypothetical protein [Flavobacterium jejuense]NHN25537.1 hypothetical protein [Flavobacterium jejuense]